MVKFKNRKTQNILSVKDEATISLMRKNPDRYEEIKAKKSGKSDNKSDDTE